MDKYIYLDQIDKDSYVSLHGETLKREYGKTPNGNDLNGQWVYRGNKGNFIDFNQYRHDISEKYNLVLM